MEENTRTTADDLDEDSAERHRHDICTTIIGEINMINNVDKHPIPPIWRHEKPIRLKPGVMQLLYIPIKVVVVAAAVASI